MRRGRLQPAGIERTRGEIGRFAVVISTSPINRIILTQSVEGIYRQTTCLDNWAAFNLDTSEYLALIVLDLTDEHAALNECIASLAALRASQDNGFPKVLGVTRGGQLYDGPVRVALALDAMISLPLTQDKIQAAVSRLLNRSLLN